MADADNVYLYWNDGANSYQMEYNPEIDIWFEHVQVIHELDSGLSAKYHKGYKLHCKLNWNLPRFFDDTQLDELRTLYNARVGISIYPAPDTNTDCNYAVTWINDFDFHLIKGTPYFGYNGTMVLEGTSILENIDADFALPGD